MPLRTKKKNRPEHSVGRHSSSVGRASRAAIVLATVFNAKLAPAQHALRNSLEGQMAVEERILALESQPYTLKTGDLRLLVAPSLDLEWNDNVTLSKTHGEDALIF